MDVRCRAPWTSLSLDPRGEVRVCCQNQWLRLGNVRDTSLTAIWHGPELARLRARLRRDDLRLGCDGCRVAVERGVGATAYFHNFDHLEPSSEVDPPWPVQLELALSNTCNLQCVMCNGELSSAIRARREHRPPLASPYDDAFFAEFDGFVARARSFSFLGGEPFLARESLLVMERLVELGTRPQCSVTTNGTIWNERVSELVAALAMDVAVSVDGASDEVLRAVRVGIDPAAFRANVERFRGVSATTGAGLRLLFSLQRRNVGELGAVLRWGDRLDVDVALNRVEHPPSSSLVFGPIDELAAAVATLESDPLAAGLGRNRGVWDGQLADLRGLLAERRAAGPAERRAAGPAAPAVWTPVHLVAADGAAAPTAAPDPLAGFAARIDADANSVVVAVSTTGEPPARLALDGLVGGSLWRVVDVLAGGLGELLHSDLEQPGTRAGERHAFVFDTGDGPLLVDAAVATHEDGSSSWELRMAPLPATDERVRGARVDAGG